jgi:hypothetical protein
MPTWWAVMLAGGLMLAPWLARADVKAMGAVDAKAVGAPVDAKAVDGRGLGLTESVLKFCEKKDPPSAPKLKDRIKQLEGGASKTALAKVRTGPDYLRARQSMDDFLGKVDDRNAARVCAGPAAGAKPTARPASPPAPAPTSMVKPVDKSSAKAK